MDRGAQPRRFLFEYTQAAVIAMIFALFVRTYLFQVFQIPSPSMEDTLLVGDHILVNKFAVTPLATGVERQLLPLADPRRGEVVTFRPPHDPDQDYVKRVIGLPGDTVRIVNGSVYLRGAGEQGFVPLVEPYMSHRMPGTVPDSLDNLGPIEVPEGRYFVMGDNRDDSLDSRDWGFVPRDNVTGRALLIYWSFAGVDPGAAEEAGAVSRLRRIFDNAATLVRGTRWQRSGQVIR
jgi:signal peptidase I